MADDEARPGPEYYAWGLDVIRALRAVGALEDPSVQSVQAEFPQDDFATVTVKLALPLAKWRRALDLADPPAHVRLEGRAEP